MMNYFIKIEYLPNIDVVLYYNMDDIEEAGQYILDELDYRIKGYKYNRGVEI